MEIIKKQTKHQIRFLMDVEGLSKRNIDDLLNKIRNQFKREMLDAREHFNSMENKTKEEVRTYYTRIYSR